VGHTSGCHSTNADDPYKFAAGNFDVTSFENFQERRDVLAPFRRLSVPAAPMVFTLLTGNLRRGRSVDALRGP
jgi:hypothetical protein